jgi:N6-adenosine-specific RNA methylase IME4
MSKKYNVIYADPAWEYSKGVYQKFRPINQGKNRLINDFYKTMPMAEMKLLPIQSISDKDCALFMWFTYSHFDKAMELCNAWGFKYKTIAFVWLKMSCNAKVLSNIGAWTMGNTEAVLIATKGNMLKHKKRNDIKQIVMPNTDLRKRGGNRHSQKPNDVRERIELLFGDVPRIELFARQNYEGWDAWGNEVAESVEILNVQPGNDMQCGVGEK